MFVKKIEIEVKDLRELIFLRTLLNRKCISKITCIRQDNDTIFISDIEPYTKSRYNNHGYGTQTMYKLFEFAKDNDFNEVKGNLSDVDKDHKDRLVHFYKKLGFDIIIYPEPKGSFWGEIIKKIN